MSKLPSRLFTQYKPQSCQEHHIVELLFIRWFIVGQTFITGKKSVRRQAINQTEQGES